MCARRLIVLAAVLAGLLGPAHAAPPPAVRITALETTPVPGAKRAQWFRFNDGRIVIDGGEVGLWSSDDGRSWTVGAPGPATHGGKTAIDLGGGEILSIGRAPTPVDGGLRLRLKRSHDDWRTVQAEAARLDVPGAADIIGDDCQITPGPMIHHGVVRLKSGVLVATAYGRTADDQTDAEAYPAGCAVKKLRAMVLFSRDGGRTWGDPVTVAWSGMIDPRTGARYAAREGFDESDIVLRPDGELLMVMRSGSATHSYPGPETPLYLARSRNGGRTWTAPVAIARLGTSPHIVQLGNGVLVVTYGGDGGWIQASADDGEGWGPPLQLTRSDSYTNLAAIGGDRCLAAYYDEDRKAYVVTRFAVTRGR